MAASLSELGGAAGIRFAGATPFEARAFVAQDLLPTFDRLHDASKLRTLPEVLAEYQRLEKEVIELGNNPHLRIDGFDLSQYTYGKWSALWNSLELRRYIYPPEASLRSVDHIASGLGDAVASEKEEKEKENPDIDRLNLLRGEVEGFLWVMGQEENPGS